MGPLGELGIWHCPYIRPEPRVFEMIQKNELKKGLCWPKRFPSNKTYSRALASCDDKEVADLLAGAIAKARAVKECGNEPSRLVV
jgi:hypothetical protein